MNTSVVRQHTFLDHNSRIPKFGVAVVWIQRKNYEPIRWHQYFGLEMHCLLIFLEMPRYVSFERSKIPIRLVGCVFVADLTGYTLNAEDIPVARGDHVGAGWTLLPSMDKGTWDGEWLASSD